MGVAYSFGNVDQVDSERPLWRPGDSDTELNVLVVTALPPKMSPEDYHWWSPRAPLQSRTPPFHFYNHISESASSWSQFKALTSPFQPPDDPWDLTSAIADVQRVTQWAREDDCEIPTPFAQSNAEQVLRDMYRIVPRRVDVYPMPDGEIALDARWIRGSSVIVLCEPAGSLLCLVNVDGRREHKRYPSVVSMRSDLFLESALHELESLLA